MNASPASPLRRTLLIAVAVLGMFAAAHEMDGDETSERPPRPRLAHVVEG